MGACQSSTAATTTGVVHGVADPVKATTSERSQRTGSTQKTSMGVSGSDTDADSHAPPPLHLQQPQQVPIKSGDTAINKSQQFKNRPGYSSGGSSFLDSSEDEAMEKAARMSIDEKTLMCSMKRHDKLCELKQELADNGDLTSKIVRIEVSVVFGRLF